LTWVKQARIAAFLYHKVIRLTAEAPENKC
jgi:hypothetical protein